MTSEDLRSQIERVPFRPLRLHLVSGKTFDIIHAGQPFMLQNAVMIVSDPQTERYDIIALRNIERLEQLEQSHGS
jgi:hypothetical protein